MNEVILKKINKLILINIKKQINIPILKYQLIHQLMSNQQSQQIKKNRKAFSKTLKAQIKRKPHTQPINGIQYTYGLLQKKSQSSLFNNQRFLIIKGHQTFGYVSKLPDDKLLPFLTQSEIPKCKIQIPLDKLQIGNQKEILTVQFLEQGKKQKTKWQFTCGSKVKAIQWRQKLQGAKNEKIMSMKNDAVKVILQDPNESIQDSQIQNNKKKNILITDFNVNKQLNKGKQGVILIDNQKQNEQYKKNKQQVNINNNNSQQRKLIKDNNNKNIRIQDDRQKSQLKQNNDLVINKQNKQGKQGKQKFGQVNIFEQLLYSSAQKQQSRLNINNELIQRSQYKQKQKQQKQINNKQQKQYFNKLLRLQKQSYPLQNKAKQQFMKRKRQQLQLRQQLRQKQQQDNKLMSSILKTITDNKYQIQKLKRQWGYQFAKSINQYQIIQHFKIYTQSIIIKIIDQLPLQIKKRYYKPISQSSQSIKYQIDNLSFQLFFHQLKQINSFDQKGSIISNHKTKQAYQQLKNYNYILQLTNNKGRIRVPLAMTVQYKGFTCLAKAIIPQAQNYNNLQSLQKQLDLLQAQSRISNSIFQDGQNGRIVPLNNKLYDKLSRAQNQTTNKKFDICYVQSLKHYLPQDFYKYNNNSGQNIHNSQNIHDSTFNNTNTKHSQQSSSLFSINPSHILRKQLIQDDQYQQNVFYGQNMSNIIHRLKMPQHLKQGIDTLVQVSKSISDRVNALVITLQHLDQFITNSNDLSKLMHGYGINMRYLGLLLQKSHQTWLKSIIISQISARCAKLFLQFELQDCITNLNQTKLQNIRRYEIKLVISFLNKILGNSQQSDMLWNQLSRQSQQNYQCYIDRKQLNIGYFIQAIQQQCRIRLINVFDNKDNFFKIVQPLNINNFSSFVINSKTYDLSFTQLYSTVANHLKDISQQSFEQLSILLNIQRKGSLSSHFQLNNYDQKIILYMINWLSPSQGRQIYYPQQIILGQIMPTKTLYQIKLTQIKWLLKDKKQQQAQKVRDYIIQHVNKWLGQYHPILSQLYDLFSRYYSINKYQQKKATTYCKSSIKNIQKLLGQSNIKLADNYYMLAQIYINYQKKTQGLNSLRRAKQILQQSESGQQTQAYGIIQLRMGQLLLACSNIKQGLSYGLKSYSRLIQGDDINKLVECIQLIGRCYELLQMYVQYNRFVNQLINNSNSSSNGYKNGNNNVYNNSSMLQLVVQDEQLLQRSLKVIIMPYMNDIKKNAILSKQLLQALNSFPSLNNTSTNTQHNSYIYIKSIINHNQDNNQSNKQKIYINQFLSILDTDLQQLLEEVESSGIMTRWKGFQNLIINKSLVNKINSITSIHPKLYQFLLTLQALTIFIGQQWIQGIITQH